MIDIKLLRADPEAFKQAARAKRIQVDIDALLDVDHRILALQSQMQEIRTEQNRHGSLIAKLSGMERKAVIEEMAALKSKFKELEDRVAELKPRFDELMLLMPQPADPEAPQGKDESENVELYKVGEVHKPDFPLKDHMQLGEALGIIDMDRGVKLSGTRNYVLRGAGAMLHQAILRLAIDQMLAKGYTLLTVPVLVRDEVMYGTGYFPVGRDQAYLVERDQMSLVGTAEVPVTALHSDEVLTEEELPKKYVALSTCFRREAGAAGKDTYGLYRIHYFDKVEQVIIAPNDRQKSVEFHQEILRNSEDVLKALGLPYRVVNVCTGDLGQGQAQKVDIETWMPSRKSYGETHSASRFYEFQARRLNLRYRDADGKVKYCHTLNNTVIASPRILIPVLELYQNADGSVTVPPVLRQYMNGMETIR